jgi:hypothetical protein
MFDMEVKIEEYEYELDPESRVFTRPRLPMLSNAAIVPFLSAKAQPPKLLLYECPFCKRLFTYPLVFKNHLYSCVENKLSPPYLLHCVKRADGQCAFTGQRKQEMINHYAKYHAANSKFKARKANNSDSLSVRIVNSDDEELDEDDDDNEGRSKTGGNLTWRKNDSFWRKKYFLGE